MLEIKSMSEKFLILATVCKFTQNLHTAAIVASLCSRDETTTDYNE